MNSDYISCRGGIAIVMCVWMLRYDFLWSPYVMQGKSHQKRERVKEKGKVGKINLKPPRSTAGAEEGGLVRRLDSKEREKEARKKRNACER